MFHCMFYFTCDRSLSLLPLFVIVPRHLARVSVREGPLLMVLIFEMHDLMLFTKPDRQ